MTTCRLLLILSLLGLAASIGCQHVMPSPLSADASAGRLESRSLADPALREFLARTLGSPIEPWPRTRWNREELMLAALFFQTDLRVALASARMSAAGIETARQRPNPTLSVQPQFVANPASGVSPWISTFQLSWMIETGGKRGLRIDASEARAYAAELAVPSTIWNIRGRLNAALASLAAAELRRGILDRALAAQGRIVALLEDRVRSGAMAESLVAPQRMLSVQLRSDRATAIRQRREARAAVTATLGVPLDAIEHVEIDFSLDVPAEEANSWTSERARRAALLSRSDIRALLAEYDAAEADLALALARQYPDVSFGPSYEFDQQSNKWGLSLSVGLPLMNQNQGPIEEAIANRDWVAARFEALQAQIIAEISSALEAFEGSAEELRQTESLVSQARERLDQIERALARGAVDRVVVLGADVELERARLLQTDAQQRRFVAAARLEQAVQPDRALLPGPVLEPGDELWLGAHR